MLTISAVSSIEYYVECSQSERDRTQYYTDSGDEPPGQWFSPGNWLAQDSATVSSADLRKIASGFDPAGGKRLVQSNTKNRRAAYDLTFSAPKSVSVLWAAGDQDQRKLIEDAHADAVRKALAKIIELGLIETRRGKDGKEREVPSGLIAGIFDHHSTRAGDPQLHSHCLLMNLCMRPDGTTGSIDNRKLMPMLKSVGAYYRSTLAKNLQTEGLTIRQKEDAFLIESVPDSVIDKWSKRRADIVNAAAAEGLTTGEDREFAQMLNLNTRKSKGDLPSRAEMEENWKTELGELGLSGEQIWKDTIAHKNGQAAEPPPSKQTAAAIVAEAVDELFETDSVIEHRKVLEKALVKSQGKCSPDLIWPALEEAEKVGNIIRLNPADDQGPAVYSTPAIIQAEREIIEIAVRRKDERTFVAPHLVDRAIRKTNRGSFKLTDEQTAAVKHALGRDAVAIIDGKAGTGKSAVFATISDAASESGMDVHLIAPSWKATTGTAKDLKNLKASQARALAGFLNKVESGKIKLSKKSLLLIDEAGMIATRDMHRLLVAADKAGAKVIMAGDAQQLAAVAAGDPLSLVISRIGAAKIEKIIRQKEAWMAAASEKFASGSAAAIREAVAEYAERGHFHLAAGRDEAMDALAEAWLSSVQAGTETGVLASRNDDVKALNELIRSAAMNAGLIKGPVITIETVGRGKTAKPGPLTIAAGDRLLLGEGIRLGGRDVANNSVLIVLRVDPGPPSMLMIQLEDGSVITVAATDLSGPKGRPVRMAYGWATTIHAAQGATFDKTLLFDAGNLKSRGAYVAMTRHKADVRIFVNAAAIKAKRAGKQEDRRLFAGAGGIAGFADEQDDIPNDDELSDGDVIKILAATWEAADRKENAIDHLPASAGPAPEGNTDDDEDDQEKVPIAQPVRRPPSSQPDPRRGRPAAPRI